ncbi:MAG TPA: TrmH family RNA methyltransferase [Magnetospirillaceae bacterium]|nr:TrmH family RNA methyltransferase [Magnetospirillaceae bacterium]
MRQPPDFIVVLCRAKEPGNVGAACRAMAAMGLSRLVLADCPDYPADSVKTFALKAYTLYERSLRCSRLDEALADCSLAAGFTQRTGRLRARDPIDVTEFSRRAVRRSGSVALVFGNERDGLSNQEISLCDMAVRIPTSEAFPSLNLAQAVQIAAWELSRAGGAGRNDGAGRPGRAAPRLEIVSVADAMADDLERAGFFKIAGRPQLVRFLRSLLARAAPSPWELEYFRGILVKATFLGSRGQAALTPGNAGARVEIRVPSHDAREGEPPCDDTGSP